jgi:hypothetical protein
MSQAVLVCLSVSEYPSMGKLEFGEEIQEKPEQAVFLRRDDPGSQSQEEVQGLEIRLRELKSLSCVGSDNALYQTQNHRAKNRRLHAANCLFLADPLTFVFKMRRCIGGGPRCPGG